MDVNILVFDGMEELDALAPHGVLKNAASVAGVDLRVSLVTAGPPLRVTAAHGLQLVADAQLLATDHTDILVVPGGGWGNVGSSVGTRAEVALGEIPALIRALHASGTLIASVCTGAMLVAAAGLLKGRKAATHHIGVHDLVRAGAEFVQARVVDEGDVVTSAGVTSGLDMALWLVERFFGAQVAQRVEVYLEYERRGTVWRR